MIGDYLTEINVTSPTCLREIEAESRAGYCRPASRQLAADRGVLLTRITPAVALAPRTGLPSAFLLSLGIHLVVIFGFLLSPAGNSAREVANRAVTVLLASAAESPEAAQAEATANQLGSLYQKAPMTPPPQDTAPLEGAGARHCLGDAAWTDHVGSCQPPASPDGRRVRRWTPTICFNGKPTSSVLATPTIGAWHCAMVMAMCDSR